MKQHWLKKLAVLTATAITLSGCGVIETAAPFSEETKESGPVWENGRKVTLAGDAVELNIRAQDDYYGYINAENLWNMSVPYGETTAGGFDEVFGGISDELDRIILDVIHSGEPYEAGSDEAIIKGFYELCANEKLTDKKIFDKIFGDINAVGCVEDLLRVSGELSYRYGCQSILPLAVIQDPKDPAHSVLCLSNEETFLGNLKEIYEEDEAVNHFREIAADLLMGLGYDYDIANEKADNIAYLWIDIAAETDFESLKKQDKEKLDNRFELSELAKFLPTSDVKDFLKSRGMKDAEIDRLSTVAVLLPGQAEKINSLLNADHLEVWKDYLRCAVCSKYNAYLPEEYTLDESGDEAVEEQDILEFMKSNCYFYLSDLYYEQKYTPEMAAYMERMQGDITKAYVKMIREADWLSAQGRELFVEKFENIHFFFGGDYRRPVDVRRKKIIGDTIVQSLFNISELQNRMKFEELNQETDITVWGMGAQEVNAYYSPEVNSIYVTTGIMHAPFFDAKADYYTNLGGIGTVICHELSHAFDNQGILYDKDGKYNPAWVPQVDRDAFQKVVDAVDAHYDEYALLEVYHVDGENTVSENLADLGSMQCVLSLTKTDNQRVNLFENYARIWCSLYQKDNIISYLTKDVHSPDPVRVNAVLSCFDEFYKVYNVSEEDGMYTAPERRVKRW